MLKSIAASIVSIALASASPAIAQQPAIAAKADRLADGMAALSGDWSGTEMYREQVIAGPWRERQATFKFSFDPAKGSGVVANVGEPDFTVTARDGLLHYAGEIGGQMMEQERKVVEFWPLDAAGNMIVVASYTTPGPGGTALEVRETYRIHDGTYIRRQEVREAGSTSAFTLIRDARFTKAP